MDVVLRNKVKSLVMVVVFLASVTVIHAGQQDENVLSGTWVLESVTAFEGEVQLMPFSIDSINVELPTEIDFRQKEITLTGKTRTTTMDYYRIVRGRFILIPVSAKWEMVNNKLQLQWFQDIPGKPVSRKITLIYSKK
jgi:hypothetical protein